jgi:hypothetical protein
MGLHNPSACSDCIPIAIKFCGVPRLIMAVMGQSAGHPDVDPFNARVHAVFLPAFW